jgi:hypothetical protein
MLGIESTLMITVSLDDGHVPLEIVQEKLFAPAFMDVTPEDGELIVVTDPEPPMNVHVPVPTIGVLPASVAVEEQIV